MKWKCVRPVLLAGLMAATTGGCSDRTVGGLGHDVTEDEGGVLTRLFGRLTSAFQDKADQDDAVVPASDWVPPRPGDDPAVDELFDVMGLEEVAPTEDAMNLDGALVGLYEHFPDESDPEDFYEELCFFAKSPGGTPSAEAMFWAEWFGVRSDDGRVSDIDGQAIGMECVGCEEGNDDGGETRVIFFVNGIRVDAESHCDNLSQIANKTGGVVIGVYNGTEGMVRDVWQTAWDRFTVQVENKLAEWGIDKTIEMHDNRAATTLMNAILHRVRAGKHVEVWAHSQGGAVTALALTRALRQLEAEGRFPVTRNGEDYPEAIRVVTFGSAASQWPSGLWPEGPIYTHYVHLRDATPSALGVGAWGGFLTMGKKRAGGDAQMVFFDGEAPADPANDPPNFTLISPDDADVNFTDLAPERYHGSNEIYFEMYEQQHGAWHY
ncbi:MAG: hypothetical protein AAGA56_08060 [Myxococcota bacterium]